MLKLFAKYSNQVLLSAYTILFISTVCSFRAITSISIGLILIFAVLKNKIERNYFFRKEIFTLFFIDCILLFIIQCIALLYTNNIPRSFSVLQRESGLILIPLSVYSSVSFLNQQNYRKLMFVLCTVLFLVSFICICIAAFHYFSGAPSSVFFYHQLVKPFNQHAIQFSILVFIALTFLFTTLTRHNQNKWLVFGFIIYFSALLILLSSKLILVFYIFFILFFWMKNYRRKILRQKLPVVIFPVLLILIAVSTSNPISHRFKDIFSGNSELFQEEKFNQGIYFNGIQFRLLQWRFVYELLNEHHAWIKGLNPGDAQFYLDKKYIETGMYIGKPATSNHGLIGYHTHNEFLQSLLETGVIGLIIFLFTCWWLLMMAVKSKSFELKAIVLLLILYSFTDAILETQYGLLIFTFFPLFIYLGNKQIPKCD